MKENLIKNLQDEASKRAFNIRKTNQIIIGLKSILVLYATFCISALVSQTPSILAVIFIASGYAFFSAIGIIIFGYVLLPLGKVSKEDIDEEFKKLVRTRIESNSEYVSRTSANLEKVEQEIKILKEL